MQSFRYNSFEFTYRQDFGKIVLLRQKPDTGEVVQQFPSEYYLRKYADSERVARTAESHSSLQAAKASAASTTTGTDVPAAPQATSGGVSAPTPTVAVAPAISSAPALPSASGSAPVSTGDGGSAGSARVNITI